MHVESNFPEAGTRSQSGEVGTGGKDGARGISNSGKTQIISRYLLARRRNASLVAHRPPPAWSATNRGNTRDRVGRSTERRGRKAHGWRQTSVLTQARRREAWRRASVHRVWKTCANSRGVNMWGNGGQRRSEGTTDGEARLDPRGVKEWRSTRK